MSVRTPAPQSAALIILSAVKGADSSTFKLKDAYNLFAQIHGFKDWATARPHFNVELAAPAEAPVVYARDVQDIQDWPRIVVTEDRKDYEDEDEVFLYPFGATLQNMAAERYSSEVLRDPGVELRLLSEFLAEMSPAELAQSVIVEEVWSQIPRVDKYSVPDFSVESAVGKFFADWFGWGYACLFGGAMPAVECHVVDSGDDGSARWWAQLRVSPQLAARMEAECSRQGYMHGSA